jgi:hypothetical protein
MSNKSQTVTVVRPSGVMELVVEEAPEDLTQSEILAKYVDMEKKWKASESWKSMENTLKTRTIGPDTKIDVCVLFGSGTFAGLVQGWINRAHVAMCQLAAFKAVVDVIGKFATNMKVLAHSRLTERIPSRPLYRTAPRSICTRTPLQHPRWDPTEHSRYSKTGRPKWFQPSHKPLVCVLPRRRAVRRPRSVGC